MARLNAHLVVLVPVGVNDDVSSVGRLGTQQAAARGIQGPDAPGAVGDPLDPPIRMT